ncbi:MAG: hypothetical protein HKO57_08150, partial [Akkermansiaceae bacterium]|nr:hypothetical protein [Akkermansiaceae bacterium]
MFFKTSRALFLALLGILPAAPATADWPQWRGPSRNGIAAAEARLPARLEEGQSLREVWRVEGIPSDRYGGHGSVAVAGGSAYLSIVWHRDEPTATRRIDGEVLATLGHRNLAALPAKVVQEMEEERRKLGRRLRGKALDEWARKWVAERLDEKTRLNLGDWIVARFRQGSAAIPLPVYDQLKKVSE